VTDPEKIDWALTTREGNRRRQREEFKALSFREKIETLERMSEVAARFARLRCPAPTPPRRE
jgi:hypothetical protein